ncbi:MAG: hypothetical protein IPK66_03185 [Rhodospirillales bacterium]|nr:hypothetical protein [Rhodospirillales bacterium]
MTHRRVRGLTPDSKHGLPIAGDLLGQTFLITRPNSSTVLVPRTPEQAELQSA